MLSLTFQINNLFSNCPGVHKKTDLGDDKPKFFDVCPYKTFTFGVISCDIFFNYYFFLQILQFIMNGVFAGGSY